MRLALLIFTQVIVQIKTFENSSFPNTMFCIIVASICVTEVCNFFTLVAHPDFRKWNISKKIISGIMSPLIPAYLLFYEAYHEIKLLKMVQDVKRKKLTEHVPRWDFHMLADLAELKTKIYKRRAFLFELRSNENSTEHLVQLIALTLIILFSLTDSPTVPGFNKVFIEEG